MANSVAYVLSKNTYPTSQEAQNVGIVQGTKIVYTTTSTLTSSNVLYADSRLTQPIYGDGENWYAVQLLTDTAVNYEITINENAVIDIFTAVYTIGQAALGGIIAYINGGGTSGTSGLVTVADPYFISSVEWGCYGTSIVGADGTAIGTGNQNTIDIVAQCPTAGIAARLCSDLVEGGYSDWYLPSKDELSALYTNRDAIGGFFPSFHWSSSEFDANTAWGLNFSNGSTFVNPKEVPDFGWTVRAVRSF